MRPRAGRAKRLYASRALQLGLTRFLGVLLIQGGATGGVADVSSCDNHSPRSQAPAWKWPSERLLRDVAHLPQLLFDLAGRPHG